jgi:hypothetical protein
MATNANETDFGIFDSTDGKLNFQFDYASDNTRSSLANPD